MNGWRHGLTLLRLAHAGLLRDQGLSDDRICQESGIDPRLLKCLKRRDGELVRPLGNAFRDLARSA